MKNGLSNDEIIAIISAELAKKGYTLTETLGKGKNRSSIKASYKTESGMSDKRVVKIPTVEIDSNSIGHLYFLSKEQDPNINEVLVANELRHENIVRFLDSHVSKINGKTYVANIEEDFDATSIEDVVNQWGPIHPTEKLEGIFLPVLAAASHASNRGILHRDYKPSNMLVNSEGKVKITDWQNAKKKADVIRKTFPTRGGTPFTHPDLLNALITGKESCASERTEIYALAASFYFAATGKNPFGYNLVEDPAGKPIEVGGRVLRPVLKEDGSSITEISLERHEANLKKALKQAPRKYRKWLYKGLTLSGDAYYNLDTFKTDFEKLQGSKKEHFIKSFYKGAKTAGIVALATAGLTAVIWIGKKIPRQPQDIPAAMQLYQQTNYANTDFESMSQHDLQKNSLLLDTILVGLEKDLDKIQQKHPKDYNKIMHKVQTWDDLRGHNKRIATSMIRACELTGLYNVLNAYGNSRKGIFAVPHQVISQLLPGTLGTGMDFLPSERQAEYALEYLKSCVGTHTNVVDIFANYFCEAEDILKARKEAGNNSYFSTTVKDLTGFLQTTGDYTKPGYRNYLPAGKRELIDKALALYSITDKEGNISFTKSVK